MSRKACCYDNAAMQSFWSTLQTGTRLSASFKTRSEARQAIFDFIETFYNRRRLHSSLAYLCPVDFERQTRLAMYHTTSVLFVSKPVPRGGTGLGNGGERELRHTPT